jgi:multisubunit Na+/H+ antiporter MnhB subunit
MRIAVLIGLLLIVLGIAALGFQSFTFFTRVRVAEIGPFHMDVANPHTIILHPIVGIVALAAGLVLVFTGRSKSE